MAKKNIAGNGGNISLPTGFNGKVNSWSATFTIYDEEVTGFDSGGCDEFEPVGVGMQGSFSFTGQFDDTSATPIPGALADGSTLAVGDLLSNAKGSATLTATTGCTYGGTIVVTGISLTRNAKGVLTGTGNFKFSGPITQTWDETA